MKQNSKVIIAIIVLIGILYLANSQFNFFAVGGVSLPSFIYQYHGVPTSLSGQVTSTDTATFNTLSITTTKANTGTEYGPYYCSAAPVDQCVTDTFGGTYCSNGPAYDLTGFYKITFPYDLVPPKLVATQSGVDADGCPRYYADNRLIGFKHDTLPTSAPVQVQFALSNENLKCGMATSNSNAYELFQITSCVNGNQVFEYKNTAAGAGISEYLMVYGREWYGSKTRSAVSSGTGCWYGYTVKNSGMTIYTSNDVFKTRKEVYVPLNINEALTLKTLNVYEKAGAVDCPYFTDESVYTCEQKYGRLITSRNYLVKSSDVPAVPSSNTKRPAPYVVGKFTGNISSYNFLIATFDIGSEFASGNCNAITQRYEYDTSNLIKSVEVDKNNKDPATGLPYVIIRFNNNLYSSLELNMEYSISNGQSQNIVTQTSVIPLGESTQSIAIPPSIASGLTGSVKSVQLAINGNIRMSSSVLGNNLYQILTPGTITYTKAADKTYIGEIKARTENIYTIDLTNGLAQPGVQTPTSNIWNLIANAWSSLWSKIISFLGG